jgi:hypothetical protein
VVYLFDFLNGLTETAFNRLTGKAALTGMMAAALEIWRMALSFSCSCISIPALRAWLAFVEIMHMLVLVAETKKKLKPVEGTRLNGR